MEYSVWNDMMSRISKFQKLAESLGCKDAMNKIVTEVVVPTGKKNKQIFEIVPIYISVFLGDYFKNLVKFKIWDKMKNDF